jgi:hypothetical protein
MIKKQCHIVVINKGSSHTNKTISKKFLHSQGNATTEVDQLFSKEPSLHPLLYLYNSLEFSLALPFLDFNTP